MAKRMQAEQQLKASLKEIDDLKAALDERAFVAIADPPGKITGVHDSHFFPAGRKVNHQRV